MMTTAREWHRALAILAGCPNGATEATLARLGIDRACLDALVDAGLVTVRTETLAKPRGLQVDRFRLKAG